MPRRLALVWALIVFGLSGPPVQSQSLVPRDVIPSRTSLSRVGLERQWMTSVPLSATERVLEISKSDDLFFVQTDDAMLHVYEAETGRHRWSAKIGDRSPTSRPVSANSFAVFATNANILSALDRGTGRFIWRVDLRTLPTSGTACDEDRLLVGLGTGMINCYDLKEAQGKGPDKIRDKPSLLWNMKTNGRVRTRPLVADRIVCMGSDDGRAFVNFSDEPTPLFRVPTGGPIGEEFGHHGTRMLLIPSADNNLYAVDVMTANMYWAFASGAPIRQAPTVAGDGIFVINEAGGLSLLDPKTGEALWTTQTDSGRFLGVSPTKVHLRNHEGDLMTIDRESGKILADASVTAGRAGLNLREYDLSLSNHFDDRLYLGTSSGVVICLREIGQTKPQVLRDPEAKPFGYVPPEGIRQHAPAPTDEDADDGSDFTSPPPF